MGPGAVAPAEDGTLMGHDFVVDHIVRGESIEEVLSRANHQVCPHSCPPPSPSRFPDLHAIYSGR